MPNENTTNDASDKPTLEQLADFADHIRKALAMGFAAHVLNMEGMIRALGFDPAELYVLLDSDGDYQPDAPMATETAPGGFRPFDGQE